MTSFGLGVYSPSEMSNICQQLRMLGLGKDSEHLCLQIDQAYYQANSKVVYRPVCTSKSRSICSVFMKPANKRVQVVFEHLITLLTNHKEGLKDKQFVKENVIALNHVATYFSTKPEIPVYKLRSIIKDITPPVEASSAPPVDQNAVLEKLKNKVAKAAKKGQAAITKAKKKATVAEQAAKDNLNNEITANKQITQNNLVQVQSWKASPPTTTAVVSTTGYIFRTLFEDDASKDIEFVFKTGTVKVHSVLLKALGFEPTSQRVVLQTDLSFAFASFSPRLYQFHPFNNTHELLFLYDAFIELGLQKEAQKILKELNLQITKSSSAEQVMELHLLKAIVQERHGNDQLAVNLLASIEKSMDLALKDQYVKVKFLEKILIKESEEKSAQPFEYSNKFLQPLDRSFIRIFAKKLQLNYLPIMEEMAKKHDSAKWVLGNFLRIISSQQEDWTTGIKLIQEVAEKHTEALWDLWEYYDGVGNDDKQAQAILNKLAVSGDLEAQIKLIQQFQKNQYCISDDLRTSDTIKWLEEWASGTINSPQIKVHKNSCIYAKIILGNSHLKGHVYPQDTTKAISALEDVLYAYSYAFFATEIEQTLASIPQSDYFTAADKGSIQAQIKMAKYLFENRANIVANPYSFTFSNETMAWLKKLAEETGSKNGQHHEACLQARFVYGLFLKNGIKGALDLVQGDKFMKSAAAEAKTNGFKCSQEMENETTVPITETNALAVQGDKNATKEMIDYIYNKKDSVLDPNLRKKETVNWLTDWADFNGTSYWKSETDYCIRARWILGLCHINGWGVSKDSDAGITWCFKATDEFPPKFMSPYRNAMQNMFAKLFP